LQTCTHNARDYADDAARFLADLQAGEEISLIVAPAIRTTVPDWQKLLGCLKEKGVKVIYDASFGAEICTLVYLHYAKEHSGFIASPCPAIVNYIEKYVPELISRLAPIQSPAICAAVYMKKHEKISGRLAFLSPCVAKADEFEDPNTGRLIEYNVTFKKLLEIVDYKTYTPAEFDNPPVGLGAIYPAPGGLKSNIQRHVKDAWVYKTEGQPNISAFLHEYVNVRTDSPLVLDALSCYGGCNTGPGACHQAEIEIDKTIHALKKETPQETLEINPSDFRRQYTPKKIMDTFVDRHDIEAAFAMLKKHSAEFRLTDCRFCGYKTCQEMAVAVAKGINHPLNCTDYMMNSLKENAHA